MTAAITIHFRKAELTLICVDSLLRDGWAPIMVWDNSYDGSKSLSVLERRYSGDSRVHLVRNRDNLGFAKGMNAALAELRQIGYDGPVLLVNNDAQVMPGMRAAMGEVLNTDTVPMLIAPRLIQGGCEQGWLYYQPWFALVTRRPVPGSLPYLSGCCLLVRRPDNSQPLFDEDFFMYGEDVELSQRMRREGAQLILLDAQYLVHEQSASSGQASASYERFMVHSHWLLAEKLGANTVSRMLMRALRLPLLSARACLRSWRFRSWVPLRALSALFYR